MLRIPTQEGKCLEREIVRRNADLCFCSSADQIQIRSKLGVWFNSKLLGIRQQIVPPHLTLSDPLLVVPWLRVQFDHGLDNLRLSHASVGLSRRTVNMLPA